MTRLLPFLLVVLIIPAFSKPDSGGLAPVKDTSVKKSPETASSESIPADTGTTGSSIPDSVGNLEPGMKAPPIVLRNISGNFIRLSDYTGGSKASPGKNKKRYNVIVAFWATYCLPCQEEIPVLEQMAEKYHDHVKLLLVSIDKQDEEKMSSFIKNLGVKSQVLLDIYQKTAGRYKVRKLPYTFLVDKAGAIVFRTSGYGAGDGLDDLRKTIEKLTEDNN